MSYYWFNRKEILQKAKERYSKEKADDYYLQNKEAMEVQESLQKELTKKNSINLSNQLTQTQ